MTYNPCLNLFKFLLRQLLGWRKKKSWEGSHCLGSLYLSLPLLYSRSERWVGCVVADCRPILAPSLYMILGSEGGPGRLSLSILLFFYILSHRVSIEFTSVEKRRRRRVGRRRRLDREREREREKENNGAHRDLLGETHWVETAASFSAP